MLKWRSKQLARELLDDDENIDADKVIPTANVVEMMQTLEFKKIRIEKFNKYNVINKNNKSAKQPPFKRIIIYFTQ